MDYQEAFDRLLKPTNKPEKQVGHKLTIRREGWSLNKDAQGRLCIVWPANTTLYDITSVNCGPIVLRYFSKDIITYRPKGGIGIDLRARRSSRRSRAKVNEFLPRGWRLVTQTLRFAQRDFRKFVILVTVNGGHAAGYKNIAVMPYAEGGIFTTEGRVAEERLRGTEDPLLEGRLDADKYMEEVEDYVDAYVEELLLGRISCEPRGAVVPKKWASKEEWEREGGKQTSNEEKIWAYVRERWMTSDLILLANQEKAIEGYRSVLDDYFREDYPFTSPAKTMRQQAAKLEHQMRTGKDLTDSRLSVTQLRRPLKLQLSRFILQNVGFDVIDSE